MIKVIQYAPSKEQMEILPPFPALGLGQIIIPNTIEEIASARAHLLAQDYVGFDTESKPTFHKGEVNTGPHIVQLATLDMAYLWQVGREEHRLVLAELLASTTMMKVGFGLKSDRGQIKTKFGVAANGIIDLTSYFKAQGYKSEVGVSKAVAIVLNQYFKKSKRQSTSNWSLEQLNNSQKLYAANDAYAALCVYQALKTKQ